MRANSRRVQENKRYENYDANADFMMRQATAQVMFALHLLGWRKKRLNNLYEMILGFENMPEMFGKKPTCKDCMDMLSKRYGIDCGRLKANKQSRYDYQKRK